MRDTKSTLKISHCKLLYYRLTLTEFGARSSQKLTPCRYVVEQFPYFDCGSHRMRRRLDLMIAPGQVAQLATSLGISGAGSNTQLRH